MTPAATIQQIRDVITKLMIASLVDHQHYPVLTRIGGVTHIGIDGAPELSISLRDIPYNDVFLGLQAAGAYHFRLIDGALVQFLYCFEKGYIKSHRLAYFPSPALAAYDEASQIYEDEELFGDIFSSFTVRSPIRFDFSSSDDEYIDLEHPKCHMTIGQHKGCRIPVDGPLTPLRFIRFILRNFYGSAYATVDVDTKATLSRFPATISVREKQILHVVG